MELRNAETFLKIVEVMNFTKAASLLGYSQGAVTAQMKQLENELGVRLFDRVGRNVRLTAAGEQFIPYARNLLNASFEAEHFALDRTSPKGRLVIIAGSSIASLVLPQLLLRFHNRYPDIQLTVGTSDFLENVVYKLRSNEIDIAFFTRELLNFEDFVLAASRPEEIVFVANAEDPLAQRKDVPLEEVLASPLVVSDREISYSHFMEQELNRMGYSVRPIMEFGSTTAIKNLLKAGAGISYLPRFVIEKELARGELAIIDTVTPELGIWTQMFYNRNRWIAPELQVFLDFIREEFR
ncbi:MAG: LysR family transcriptional regulator [Mogibacterium sp.]|nr:LysR family transcriptional regulator [Mogibacterium sp.]